jgi:hypothetical protein
MRAYEWALQLERDGLARLITTHDPRGWRALKPFLLDEDSGLVTIWNYLGSIGWALYPGVFERRAKQSRSRVEALLGEITLEAPEQVGARALRELTAAYREAAGSSRAPTRRTRGDRRSVGGSSSVWRLSPGDTLLRTEMQADYGGRVQGGMTTSRTSPNILLFAEPRVGERLGYFDGWEGSHFHYTGKGRRGDQEITDMNRALLLHEERGLAIRLFRAERQRLTYLGQFTLDTNQPVYRMDAPQIGTTRLRQVLVFKLVPRGRILRESRDDRHLPAGLSENALEAVLEGAAPIVRVLAVEEHHATHAVARRPLKPIVAERRELPIVRAFKAYLEARGSEVGALGVVPTGEANEIFNDLYDKTRGLLVEAKATGTRDAVRMALGQLLDYGRFKPHAKRAILLPTRPRPDLEELLLLHGIHAVWREGDGFSDNCNGDFT